MKKPLRRLLAASFCSLVLAAPLAAQDQVAQEQSDDWTTIDASSLDEWSDPGDWWKVEDGMFVAESEGGETLPAVHYLVWDGSIKGDFELTLQYRIQADQPRDAGVNFRVERPFEDGLANLPGYQAELDTANLYGDARAIRRGKLFGNIHDGKRGRMFQRSQKVTIAEDGSETSEPLRPGFQPPRVFRAPPEWNDVRIRVVGDHIQLYLNGVLANEIIDHDAENKSTGDAIALQFRPRDKFRYEVKELKYRALEEGFPGKRDAGR